MSIYGNTLKKVIFKLIFLYRVNDIKNGHFKNVQFKKICQTKNYEKNHILFNIFFITINGKIYLFIKICIFLCF